MKDEHYLVIEKDGTKHLPVYGEDAKPDHHLMGAAWAALHEGYRGNKYEGPDKDKAIEKLKALYKSEGMPLPGHAAEAKGKAIALTGLSTALKSASGADLWIVYLPKGDRTVDQVGGDQQPTKLRVNPTALSAKRMEAARRLIAAKPQANQPYVDYNHDDAEASGRPLRFAWHDEFGVIGLTRRTLKAVEATTGDPPEFQAFSPHVPIDPDTGEALGIYMNCGGFVNRPLFGNSTSLSAAAHLSTELVAADPNAVALVAVAPGDEETNAADKERRMKELIAKLCAAFKITKPVDQVTEPELITAFEQSQTSHQELFARAGMVEPIIVALGFAKGAAPKTEELAAKITALGAPGEIAIGKRLVGFAAKVGLIAPAEEADWNGKMERDPQGWTAELIKKTPTVLIGKVMKESATTEAAAGGADPNKAKLAKYHARVEELCAKDPKISEVYAIDPVKAKSLATERIAKEEPSLLVS